MTIKDKISVKIAKYVEQTKSQKGQNLIKNAFVVFRSMEGVSRLIKAYEISKFHLCCLKSCYCCCEKGDYQDKLFHGKYLKVERAVEPSLILWENLRISKR